MAPRTLAELAEQAAVWAPAPTFTFTADRQGAHAHIVVRVGIAGQRARCGEITMRIEEWEALRARLAPGSESDQVVLPVVPSAEDLLVGLVRARRACESPDQYYLSPESVQTPIPAVIAFGASNGKDWEPYGHDPKRGHVSVEVAGQKVYVHDVPRPPPAEAPPLPACGKCGSTANALDCPCGSKASSPDPLEMDF